MDESASVVKNQLAPRRPHGLGELVLDHLQREGDLGHGSGDLHFALAIAALASAVRRDRRAAHLPEHLDVRPAGPDDAAWVEGIFCVKTKNLVPPYKLRRTSPKPRRTI